MLEYVSKKIANWLVSCDEIKREECELYEYAIQSIIMLLLPFGLIIILGAAFKMILEDILLVVSFMSVRRYSGGFHAKKAYMCVIVSCFSVGISLVLIKLGIPYYIFVGFYTISLMIVLITAPQESSNKPLKEWELVKYKRYTCFCCLILTVVCICFCCFERMYYAKCIMAGIILAAIFQILGIRQNKCKKRNDY